jgi:heparin binding hemagglutinin HbhA
MVALPKTEDVRKAGEHAVEVLRTPLLAALGAGDLATQAVRDAVNRTRGRVNEGAGAARGAVEGAVGDLPRELPRDLAGVREKLDPAELRKLVDEYTEAAQKLYQKLADQGEDTLNKLRTQPQVRKAIDQLEEAIATLQTRVGDAAGDARELAEEVLAKVTRRTRSAGETTARTVEHQASEVAEAIEKTGDEVAKETRRTTRRTPARTEPRKPPAARGNNARKPPTK